jgi:hypothetical protein
MRLSSSSQALMYLDQPGSQDPSRQQAAAAAAVSALGMHRDDITAASSQLVAKQAQQAFAQCPDPCCTAAL